MEGDSVPSLESGSGIKLIGIHVFTYALGHHWDIVKCP